MSNYYVQVREKHGKDAWVDRLRGPYYSLADAERTAFFEQVHHGSSQCAWVITRREAEAWRRRHASCPTRG